VERGEREALPSKEATMEHPRKQAEPRAGDGAKKPAAVGHLKRILVADDDAEMCRLIASTLRREGYSVTMCANGINLLDHLGSYLLGEEGENFELIITDIRMPGFTGMEILRGLRHSKTAPPIILTTAFGDAETHREAAELGAVTVLDKPFEMGTLLKLTRKALAN
jgi:DNA-binding response OmpR family regulator